MRMLRNMTWNCWKIFINGIQKWKGTGDSKRNCQGPKRDEFEKIVGGWFIFILLFLFEFILFLFKERTAGVIGLREGGDVRGYP